MWSTALDSGYITESGTSFSAPFISGVLVGGASSQEGRGAFDHHPCPVRLAPCPERTSSSHVGWIWAHDLALALTPKPEHLPNPRRHLPFLPAPPTPGAAEAAEGDPLDPGGRQGSPHDDGAAGAAQQQLLWHLHRHPCPGRRRCGRGRGSGRFCGGADRRGKACVPALHPSPGRCCGCRAHVRVDQGGPAFRPRGAQAQVVMAYPRQIIPYRVVASLDPPHPRAGVVQVHPALVNPVTVSPYKLDSTVPVSGSPILKSGMAVQSPLVNLTNSGTKPITYILSHTPATSLVLNTAWWVTLPSIRRQALGWAAGAPGMEGLRPRVLFELLLMLGRSCGFRSCAAHATSTVPSAVKVLVHTPLYCVLGTDLSFFCAPTTAPCWPPTSTPMSALRRPPTAGPSPRSPCRPAAAFCSRYACVWVQRHMAASSRKPRGDARVQPNKALCMAG